MYLKLVSRKANGEFDSHLIEGDHFHWGWSEQWPDEYYLPFPIGEGPDDLGESLVMVVEVFKDEILRQSIVVFQATGYFMNADGKTIDKFAA